ncbi:MAG: pyridoxal-phosphate dependent enzyme [Pyrinomonadaceae bacterium]|nr:pyridoxal-phosphate dependent enzyme [Pyrinomonadaceae bacterium]
MKSYGATVDLIDVKNIGRGERVAQLAEDMPNAYIACACDDLLVIEGNASLGDELRAKDFDVVISPIGGGGLASGIVTGLSRNATNQAKVFGAEPLLANDAARSLQAGKIIRNENEPNTIADGARAISLGILNWEILAQGLTEIIEVSEENIKKAVRLYFSLANLKVEPTGALSLGAILENIEKFADKKICLIVSGGNVDTQIYREILAGN